MYQLAQINVARMIGANIQDPIMLEFVDNLDHVNALAESSPGFVWRLKDDQGNATGFNPLEDEQIIINISVWQDIASLESFTYKTFHTDFLKRRKEWFHRYGKAHYALWWIKVGEFPTVIEAFEKLEYLQSHGASELSFSFKERYPPPLG
jgi:hypothetical protein